VSRPQGPPASLGELLRRARCGSGAPSRPGEGPEIRRLRHPCTSAFSQAVTRLPASRSSAVCCCASTPGCNEKGYDLVTWRGGHSRSRSCSLRSRARDRLRDALPVAPRLQATPPTVQAHRHSLGCAPREAADNDPGPRAPRGCAGIRARGSSPTRRATRRPHIPHSSLRVIPPPQQPERRFGERRPRGGRSPFPRPARSGRGCRIVFGTWANLSGR
jgi:hypothetical protein